MNGSICAGAGSAASAPGEAERAGIAHKASQGIPRDSGGISPRNDES